ncbi:MAG: hypothetical protein VCF08_13705 [Alphaproteobacteria bacterium]
MTADTNRVLCCGENPFIRLSESDGGPETTVASLWRNVMSPAGPGHVLYLKSELTGDNWRIWSDNIAMTGWLQQTIQGVLIPELADLNIPVEEAEFEKDGDPHRFYTEYVTSEDTSLSLTWHDLGDPLMIHTQPGTGAGERPYGVNTVLIPASGTRLVLDGEQAAGRSWARDRDGRSFSTSALAFCESWTEAR